MIKKILKKIKKFLNNDVVERCYKTFFQAFIGVILTASATDLIKISTLKTLIVAGVIAGLSATWNILKMMIDKKINKLKK